MIQLFIVKTCNIHFNIAFLSRYCSMNAFFSFVVYVSECKQQLRTMK